ncbi:MULTISPECIES: DUF4255 domain-containing protein [Dickeya]|uniref:Pvc16 N-terminal domain-containing protein n=1 Tax=Dickeya aquatica TaxID=1401087 RepID=A0A375AEV8_9GAMM|nr:MULTISPECIES: DUF4255 domain-containing protein [Dickeya]SLM64537.1 hypothetical protein DAQ1742_03743 [Dickeya aquatica]
MISASLDYLAKQLNQYLKNMLKLHDELVVIANPADDDGKMFPLTKNKLVIFLAGIEKETLPHRNQAMMSNNRYTLATQPLYVRVNIMVAANFTGTQYPQGLTMLAHAMAFLHKNPQFNRYNAPDMDGAIEQILVEMENLPRQDVALLWQMLGSRYLPSTVYRLRVMIAGSHSIQSQAESVGQVDVSVSKS